MTMLIYADLQSGGGWTSLPINHILTYNGEKHKPINCDGNDESASNIYTTFDCLEIKDCQTTTYIQRFVALET